MTRTESDHPNRVGRAYEKAFAFGLSLGVETYDPFDTKGSRLGMWAYADNRAHRVLARKLLNGADLFFPLFLRKVLRVPKKASSGGVARWSQANLSRFRLSGDEESLNRAYGLLQWLRDHHATAKIGKAWGLPFEWQAFVPVPAESPVGHSTMNVGNALLDYTSESDEQWIEDELHELCTFLCSGLNRTVRESGSVALSYTPLDHSQVMNTNAEIASLLLRVGRSTGNDEWVELSAKLMEFVLETQNGDGSWFYSAPDAGEGRQVIDHYHTGMILTALMEYAQQSPFDNDLRARTVSSVESGFQFHLDEHFSDQGHPLMRPGTVYPVDSYSCGESILLFVAALRHPTVSDNVKNRAGSTLKHLVDFVIDQMMYSDGCFVYRKWPVKAMRVNSMRWAQALLCHALSEYLLFMKEERDAQG